MSRANRTAAMSVATVAIFGAYAALAEPSTVASATSSYRAECGSCHLAYPARLLSTREWGIVLGHLEHHYGVDATVDDPTLRLVAQQLDAPVTSSLGDTGRLPRITSKDWFVDEHDEVAAGVFRSAAVKSAGNCAACHAGAERGDFDEDAVRVPGGKRHD
jgi:nitrate/TMAO reductase-like tetraheme cytochrome c subunit